MQDSPDQEKRKYLRHPIHLPLALHVWRQRGATPLESADISQGGLSFMWRRPLAQGNRLSITIPVKDKQFKISAQVAYSEKDPHSGFFRTGAAFQDANSAFRAKLAEETLEILDYRKKISKALGHEVPEEEAAREWISRFAEKFSPR